MEGTLGTGNARFADKVVKIPSKRGPQALRLILDDFENNSSGTSFELYYAEKGERYFYDLLKPLSDVESLKAEDFIDWGSSERYKKAIGVGECAGVVIDLVATLLFESEEKIQNAKEALDGQKWAASIYHSYSSMVNAAKALLTSEKTKANTHSSIIRDFDSLFVSEGRFDLDESFEALVLQLNKKAPTEAFAKEYLEDAERFLKKAESHRKLELAHV